MLRSCGSEAALDEPEPRLAICGPPAITRRMFALWRADPSLQAKFDLRDPLRRRDYALQLSEEGRARGLDRQSVDAAIALVRRGASLCRAPPPWPMQSAMPMARPDADVDAWLAEPIAWGAPPGGIPMPRALALLWELRQDVRWHFPNRTRAEVLAYLAWCLTQGVRDRCVAPQLVAPALASFLDALAPELDPPCASDGPPLTRLLRIMAPLYDGRYPEIAQDFPHTRQSRLAVAIWICGTLRRRLGWPRSLIGRPWRWLSEMAPAADAFVPLTNLVLGLWEISPHRQARYDIASHEGRSALLGWFHAEGAKQVELEDLTLTHSALRAAWARVPLPIGKPAMKRDLCLVGYAGLASGRAEDLRMTALALRRQHRDWAVLDRLSGAITTEDGRSAAAFAASPRVTILHLNADTAFFDYGFLRERGLEHSYKIGYWAWELARFPEEWAASFAFVDEIWVSSRFAYEAIAPATTKPVMLMPMAVALPPLEPGLGRADFGLPGDKFVFYFSFDFRSYTARKNPLAAVEAFRRAFPRRAAPAVLVLKTIGSDWKPDDRDNLREAIGSDARIVIIDGEFARPRAVALLALSDCFVSLHRSEGFGRGPAEAMLLGKPVISIGYSGPADFATKDTALLVDYELVPVGEGEYPGANGQIWAAPDIDSAAAAMRRIVADPALAGRLARAGRELIRRQYGPQLVGRNYVDRISAITKGPKCSLAPLAGRGTG
jgi:glycosyltransferase involved in cell wall biosynthesis